MFASGGRAEQHVQHSTCTAIISLTSAYSSVQPHRLPFLGRHGPYHQSSANIPMGNIQYHQLDPHPTRLPLRDRPRGMFRFVGHCANRSDSAAIRPPRSRSRVEQWTGRCPGPRVPQYVTRVRWGARPDPFVHLRHGSELDDGELDEHDTGECSGHGRVTVIVLHRGLSLALAQKGQRRTLHSKWTIP